MRRRTHRTHPYQRALTGVAVLALSCLAGPYDLSMADEQDFPVKNRLEQPSKKPAVDDSGETGDADSSEIADTLDQGPAGPGQPLTTWQKRLFVLGIEADEKK